MWRLLILCGDNFVTDYLKKLTYGWLFFYKIIHLGGIYLLQYFFYHLIAAIQL